MRRTKEEVLDLMKDHKFKLKSFILYGRNGLCKEYGDENSPKFIGKENQHKVYTENTFLAIDAENDTIEYLFNVRDADKKYPDVRIITKIGVPCKFLKNPLFSIVNFPDGEPAVLMDIVKFDIRYACTKEGLAKPSEIVKSDKWILITRSGQVFANYSSHSGPSDEIYEADTEVAVQRLFSIDRVLKEFNNVDFLDRSYYVIYNEYISKVLPKYVYYKRDFLSAKSLLNVFNGVLGYKEPERKKSKNQDFIDRMQEYDIIENNTSKISIDEIEAGIYDDNNRYRFSAVINRLNSKDDIAVVRIFPRESSIECLRLYVDKKKAVYAFLNRDNEWIAMPTPSAYQPPALYNIQYMDRYAGDIVAGTKLQYILPLMAERGIRNSGDGIYALLKDTVTEEFVKSKYYISETDYVDQKLVRNIFGKVNPKKRGFLAKVGMTKNQMDLIYKYADLLTDRDIELFNEMAERYSYRDDVERLKIRTKIQYIKNCFYCLKKVFAGDDCYKDEYFDFTSIDFFTFEKVLSLIKGPRGNDVFTLENLIELYYSTGRLAENKNYRCLQILEKVHKTYSPKAFQNVLEYLYENVGKNISYTTTRYTHCTYRHNSPMEEIYEDYLNMVMELGEDRSWYPPIEKLYEEHEKVLEKYNAFLRFKRSPCYINDHMKALAEKHKDLEYSDDKYTIFHPLTGDEIIDEGRELKHCVGSYVSNVVDGSTSIFFIRKISEKEKPFFTLELKDGVVRQVHGKCNCGTSTVDDLDDFVTKWAKEKNLKYSKRQAGACLAAGY